MNWQVNESRRASVCGWGLMALVAAAMLVGWQWGKAQNLPPCLNNQNQQPCQTDVEGNRSCDGIYLCQPLYTKCFPQATFCPETGANMPYVQTEYFASIGTCVDAASMDACVRCGDINDPAKRVCAFVCAIQRAFKNKDETGQCRDACRRELKYFARPGECARPDL